MSHMRWAGTVFSGLAAALLVTGVTGVAGCWTDTLESSPDPGGTGGGGANVEPERVDVEQRRVTWTEIYDTMFGPKGTSTCGGASCHLGEQSGFRCGETKSECYVGLVYAGLINGGASSLLGQPERSPLCWSLDGGTPHFEPFRRARNMPPNGHCITDVQLQKIRAWLDQGAPND
jgi:hypothetical protein